MTDKREVTLNALREIRKKYQRLCLVGSKACATEVLKFCDQIDVFLAGSKADESCKILSWCLARGLLDLGADEEINDDDIVNALDEYEIALQESAKSAVNFNALDRLAVGYAELDAAGKMISYKQQPDGKCKTPVYVQNKSPVSTIVPGHRVIWTSCYGLDFSGEIVEKFTAYKVKLDDGSVSEFCRVRDIRAEGAGDA